MLQTQPWKNIKCPFIFSFYIACVNAIKIYDTLIAVTILLFS